jgi:aminoglycoside phosphotransferase
VDLLAELRGRRPASEDLVVTHGDLTLGNILAVGAISGIIDLDRTVAADRYQDLALMDR